MTRQHIDQLVRELWLACRTADDSDPEMLTKADHDIWMSASLHPAVQDIIAKPTTPASNVSDL